jgi:hypothetical protein
MVANEAQNRHRIERTAARASIGLAVIAAMAPEPAEVAVRTSIRPVDLGRHLDGTNMLGQSADGC